MKFTIAARLLFAGLLGFITWMTLTTNPDDTEQGLSVARFLSSFVFGDETHADKVAHFIAYLSLGGAAALADLRLAGRRRYAAAALIAYGAVLEGAQGAMGVRSPETADAVANALGALAGLAAGDLLLRIKGARS